MAANAELIDWLTGKLADAEIALRIREDMARTWRHGSDEAWAAAAMMHPSTAGRSPDRAARITEAKKHARIATRLRQDVEMFRATLAHLKT